MFFFDKGELIVFYHNRNEMLVEIGKTQEGLNVFNLVGFRPILNDLDIVGGHGETAWRKDVA